jgi:hypothetical protein
MAIVGALALALGLAFGLGGRETAAQIVRGWYDRGQQAAPKMAEAADAAQHQAHQPAAPTLGPAAANGTRSATAQTFVAVPRQP